MYLTSEQFEALMPDGSYRLARAERERVEAERSRAERLAALLREREIGAGDL